MSDVFGRYRGGRRSRVAWWLKRTTAAMLLGAFGICAAPLALAGPMTVTAQGSFLTGFVDARASINVFDGDGGGDSAPISIPLDGFGPAEEGPTLSPGFNAFLEDNQSISTTLEFDSDQPANEFGQFEADSFQLHLTDPATLAPLAVAFDNSNISLVDGEPGAEDRFFGFGFDPRPAIAIPENFEDEVFDAFIGFDPSALFEQLEDAAAGLGLAEGDISRLVEELSLDGELLLPDGYALSFGLDFLRDESGGAVADETNLNSVNFDEFNIGGGPGGSTIQVNFGGPVFDILGGITLDDGRQVEIMLEELELVGLWSIDSLTVEGASGPEPTPEDVISEFDAGGELPEATIEGVFNLPDGSAPSEMDAVVINDETLIPTDSFFFNAIELGTRQVFDPVVAVGYDYQIDNGAFFTDVLLPALVPTYEVSIFNPNTSTFNPSISLAAGVTLDFLLLGLGFDVARFAVTGIDPALMVDPTDDTAFPALIGVGGIGGTANITQTVLTLDVPASVPVPAGVALVLLGLGLLAQRRKFSS